MSKEIIRFLNFKKAELWHPESPGVKLVVVRSWIGRLIKPSAFATLGESIKSGIVWSKVNE